jgi:hypothetical protein
MRWIISHPTLACCLLLCSCASASGPRRVSPQDLISPDEVLGARSANTAYDLVAHLRPSFLQSRGPTSLLLTTPTLPDLSIDGGQVEQIDVLRSISARDVVDMRLLGRSKAEQMLGGTHEAGTILVRLRRSR